MPRPEPPGGWSTSTGAAARTRACWHGSVPARPCRITVALGRNRALPWQETCGPPGQDGLIVMLPRSEGAEITWAAAAALGTVTVLEPTYVCVSIAYEADPGTSMLIGPTFVDACTDAGAAEKTASMPPASDFSEAVGEVRPVAAISPALVCALTGPASEVSVIAPASLDTRTATPAGTWTS